MIVPDILAIDARDREARGRSRRRFRRRVRRQKFPKGAEREYRVTLINYVDTLIADVEAGLIPQLRSLENQIGLRTDDKRSDVSAWVGIIEDVLGELDKAASETSRQEQLERDAAVFAQEVSRFGRIQTFQQLKGALGVDLFVAEPQLQDMLADFTNENVALIKSIPKTFHDRIGRIVRDEFRQGARAEQVQEKIRATYDVTRNRAILIARDQSNKLTGQTTRMRQTNLGIESYRWRTSQDDRVRPSHAANEGRVIKWSEPPAETGHPGQDVNCRCTAEPVFDDLFD